MNCECVFVSKTDRQNPTKILVLATALLQDVSNNAELYPVAHSQITMETKTYNTYDEAFGWTPKGRYTKLNTGDHVLFVAGKYHYMTKTILRGFMSKENRELLKDFQIVFPATTEPFFDDLYLYE